MTRTPLLNASPSPTPDSYSPTGTTATHRTLVIFTCLRTLPSQPSSPRVACTTSTSFQTIPAWAPFLAAATIPPTPWSPSPQLPLPTLTPSTTGTTATPSTLAHSALHRTPLSPPSSPKTGATTSNSTPACPTGAPWRARATISPTRRSPSPQPR